MIGAICIVLMVVIYFRAARKIEKNWFVWVMIALAVYFVTEFIGLKIIVQPLIVFLFPYMRSLHDSGQFVLIGAVALIGPLLSSSVTLAVYYAFLKEAPPRFTFPAREKNPTAQLPLSEIGDYSFLFNRSVFGLSVPVFLAMCASDFVFCACNYAIMRLWSRNSMQFDDPQWPTLIIGVLDATALVWLSTAIRNKLLLSVLYGVCSALVYILIVATSGRDTPSVFVFLETIIVFVYHFSWVGGLSVCIRLFGVRLLPLLIALPILEIALILFEDLFLTLFTSVYQITFDSQMLLRLVTAAVAKLCNTLLLYCAFYVQWSRRRAGETVGEKPAGPVAENLTLILPKIIVQCSVCNKRYAVPPTAGGRRFRCKQCNEIIQITSQS